MDLRKIFIALIILLALLEGMLRFTGILKTYSESNYGYFLNPFDQSYDSHFWLWPPQEDVTIYNAEFTYQYVTNSMGLVDRELDSFKTRTKLSFIGDSFTHGQGAPQDSSLPRQFERYWQVDQPDAAVLNAGIPSGDLFYYSKLVEDILLPAGFRQFAFVLNTSDIYDYMWLGGRERFQEDGTTRSRKSPWYMGLYRKSHTFRAVFHGILGFDHSYLSRTKTLELKGESIAQFTVEFGLLKTLLEQHGAEFTIIIHPVARYYSVKNKNYVRDYAYLEGMAETLEEQGFHVVNMRPLFAEVISEENYLDYSWKLDKHFNSKGYDLFAKLAYRSIKEGYPELLRPLAIDSVTTITSQNQP